MAINIFPETGDDLSASQWQTLNRALGMGYAISEGLETSGDAGNVTRVVIQPGVALINGKLVELASATNYDSLPTTTDNYHLFIKEDGSITHTTGTTAPAGNWICLGNIYITSSAISWSSCENSRDVFDSAFVRGQSSTPGRWVFRAKHSSSTIATSSTSVSEFEFTIPEATIWYIEYHLSMKANSGSPATYFVLDCTEATTDVIVGWLGMNKDNNGLGMGTDLNPTESYVACDTGDSYVVMFALVIGGVADGTMQLKMRGTDNTLNGVSHMVARRIHG